MKRTAFTLACLPLTLTSCSAPTEPEDANVAPRDAHIANDASEPPADAGLDAGETRDAVSAVDAHVDEDAAPSTDAGADVGLDAQIGDASSSGDTWHLERVADIHGANVAITVGADGTPHISFDDADAATYRVRYSTRVGTGWRTELTSGSDATTLASDIAVDAVGNPCVAYLTTTFEPKVSCRMASGSWRIERAGTNPGSAPFAIEVSASGEPWVAYNGAHGLAYAARSSGTWSVTAATSTFRLDRFVRMEADVAGAPQVIYGETLGASITLATPAAPTWMTRALAMAGGVVQIEDADLAFDASGRRHVAYTVPSVAVREVRYIDPATSTESVVEHMGAGQLSIGVGPSGIPHVVYRTASAGLSAVRHAWRTDGTWHVESVVERNGIPALAVGPDGRLHVAYRDGETSLHSVWYATRLP